MKTTLLDSDYTSAYERKKANSEKRNIQFLLTEAEYTAIMKARPTMVCGYTNQKFIMNKGSGHKSYPELDRIDPNKPYQKDNIIFCLKKVHKIKTDYVENNKSRKGMSHGNVCVLRSIEKLLSMNESMEARLAPYYEIYDKVTQREQELSQRTKKEEAVIHAKVLREQKEAAEKVEEARKAKVVANAKAQLEIAEHFRRSYEEFEKLGLVFELTLKELRDRLRISKCAITGVQFTDTMDKHFWVIDKTKPITKDNLVVCKKNVQESLDYLSGGDNMILKTAMLNVLKKV